MAHINFHEQRVGIFAPDPDRHAAMADYARGLRASDIVQHDTTPTSSRLADDAQRVAGLIRSSGFGVVVASDKDPVAVAALEMLHMVGSPHPAVLQEATKPRSGEMLMHIGNIPYRIVPAAAGRLSVAETIV